MKLRNSIKNKTVEYLLKQTTVIFYNVETKRDKIATPEILQG